MIDVENRSLSVALTPEEMQVRLAGWIAPVARYANGVYAKYARLVADASHGAVTDLGQL